MIEVEQGLREWQEIATGEMADALRELLRADQGRLEFWAGPALDNPEIEALDGSGDGLAAARQASLLPPYLPVAIGWIQTEDSIAAHAWLIDSDGGIADPARERLEALGYLGIELRFTELARWTPTGSLVELGAAPLDRNFVT